MSISDKMETFPQLSQQKKQKKKAFKPFCKDLPDTELVLSFQYSDNYENHEHLSQLRLSKTKQLSFYEKKMLKQNYLQGNFKFFVNPDYEENITYVDPDQEIKWKTVEKVKYITNHLIKCPICLNHHYDVIFPKTTRCGHIFCLPCILKYLSYKKTKCPLCDDFLMEDDLRTVQIVYYSVIHPGEKIFLKLKKRRKSENTVYNGESLVEEEDFIRIKKVGWDEILGYREEEMRSLMEYLSLLEIEGNQEVKPYIEQGLRYLDVKMEKINKKREQARQRRDEEEVTEDETNEEEFLYFYQEKHGLNIFLHPMYCKHIRLQYSDVNDLPLVLEANLIDSRGFQQSELSQRRYKFLNHIPLNSDISFVEIEMKDILAKERQHEFNKDAESLKENNDSIKDLNSKTLLKLAADQLPAKPVTVATERKYKIEFPAAPSGLKLDNQEYPELSNNALQSSVSSVQSKSGWAELVPKKKLQEKKDKTASEKSVAISNIQEEKEAEKIKISSLSSDNKQIYEKLNNLPAMNKIASLPADNFEWKEQGPSRRKVQAAKENDNFYAKEEDEPVVRGKLQKAQSSIEAVESNTRNTHKTRNSRKEVGTLKNKVQKEKKEEEKKKRKVMEEESSQVLPKKEELKEDVPKKEEQKEDLTSNIRNEVESKSVEKFKEKGKLSLWAVGSGLVAVAGVILMMLAGNR